MDNLRLVLVFSLAIVLLLIYQAWMQDYGSVSTSGAAGQLAASQGTAGDSSANLPQGVPQVAVPGPSDATVPGVQVPGTPSVEPIRVETDVLRLEISPRGGTLSSAWLLDYPGRPRAPGGQVPALQARHAEYVHRPVRTPGDRPRAPADPRGHLRVHDDQSWLEPGQDALEVVLTWSHAAGVQVLKRYGFERGSYCRDPDPGDRQRRRRAPGRSCLQPAAAHRRCTTPTPPSSSTPSRAAPTGARRTSTRRSPSTTCARQA